MWKRYAKTNAVFVWMVVKEYVKRRAQGAQGKERRAWRIEHGEQRKEHSASADYADFRRFKDKEKYRVGPSEIVYATMGQAPPQLNDPKEFNGMNISRGKD